MSEYKVGSLRLRSVRLKSGGGEIRVMPGPTRDDDLRYAERRLLETIRSTQGRVAGFAMVAWSPDNGSVSVLTVNEGSKIPSIMVPDFVRNRLLAAQIEAWTLDTLAAATE